jgi:hypothetical protein
LGATDLDALHGALSASPKCVGIPLEQWSLAAVAFLIQRCTGVAYHRRHIPRVLRRAGWSVLPVGQHADKAIRMVPHFDPDGNMILLSHRPRRRT